MGNHWNLILWSYPFQKGRTSVDLSKKYYRLQLQVIIILFSTNHIRCQLSFQLLPRTDLQKKGQANRIWNQLDCALCQFNAVRTLSIRMVSNVIQSGLVLGERELTWENTSEPLNLPVPPDRIQRG